ncbi:MAG: HAD family hydrolase [Phycisphaerae bacterium]|nr:HAD family hydrolase [Phycisphaerae bacterium]
MTFRAVLFDLDNTLCDVVSARVRYAVHAARAAGIQLDAAGLRHAAEEGTETVTSLLKHEQVRRAAWRTMPSHDIACHVEFSQAARSVVERIGSQAQVGIVSNGRSRTQMVKLRQALGDVALWPIVISGQVGVRKPARRIFDHALALLGMPADEVLFVGDDPLEDMLGAARVGMRACWISHGRSPEQLTCAVDYVIEAIDELPEAIHA